MQISNFEFRISDLSLPRFERLGVDEGKFEIPNSKFRILKLTT